MVNPGGTFLMLGHWRIAIRQAEEMARAGRLDEALGLAARPEVADHRQAVLLRARLVQDLLGRGARRAEADDLAGAMDDLDLAERHNAALDVLAAARLALADRVAGEIGEHLAAGEPARVIERVEALARRKVGGPALRRAREAAEAWLAALDEASRGEFGRAADHLDRAGRLAGIASESGWIAARRDLDRRRDEAHPRVEALYKALEGRRWSEVLALAEAVLALAPEHPAAREARSRAWRQIAALGPRTAIPPRSSRVVRIAAAAPEPVVKAAEARPVRPRPGEPGGRFLLWADTIGGYLVCLDDRVVLGRSDPAELADVPILGDLSRQHATLERDGDGYILRPRQPGTTFVNGRPADAGVLLRDGDVIRLGSTLELEFRQPSPVSTTARLRILSRHRFPLAVEGVILMAETCILGPSAQAHVPAPGLDGPVILYRQGRGLWCRADGTFEVDGQPAEARAALAPRSRVQGEGFSFSLEPLAPRSA